ncbi:DUF998 domain-containing protein [Lacticaseibacillus pabuli]|uniref:DUF998 domain-containing protein n=1 Tax=Lacticaseibacillus pabuli TaxID=3025672 RepID=A0ABY7WQR7_9LACO|nr:DUF998 domain-containing protein [Lacticaseibacillus sp. KACC 23028]WDF81713.1 DUF998 domain-containing protein [Lacticaseibacillus sp. KACC 23028]
MNTNRIKLGSLGLALGALVFWITEFITAAAWSHPAYSYTYDFISNLGVRGPSVLFGQTMISPLSWLMNLGFMSFGVLIFIGILNLPLTNNWRRWVLVGLAVALMIGGILVGYFHGSGEALIDGTGMYHSLGAFVAFTAGNCLMIALGRLKLDLLQSNRVRKLLVILGIIGLLGMFSYLGAIIFSADNHPLIIIGLIERTAVYPILIGSLMTGYQLRRESREAPHQV